MNGYEDLYSDPKWDKASRPFSVAVAGMGRGRCDPIATGEITLFRVCFYDLGRSTHSSVRSCDIAVYGSFRENTY